MIRIITVLCLLLSGIVMRAQNMSVASFALDERDLTANLQGTIVLDQNGEKCALIRIQTYERGFTFDVGVLGVQKVDDNKTGEIWVYVPAGVKRITLRHPNPGIGTLIDYPFPVTIQAARTYRMELVTGKVTTIVQKDDGMTYFSMTVKPANAFVMVDGEMKPLDADGSLMLRMKRGEHTYSVQAAGHAPENGTFTLGAQRLSKSVVLRSVLASLTVSCATPGAQIYVNDELRGSGSWTGSLIAGDYRVEARKDGHHSQTETVTLIESGQKTLTLPALIARTGTLDVGYKPVDSEVYIDGKKVGMSPDIFRTVLMGQHEVEIRKAGYVSAKQTVTIEEGQTITINGTLEKKTTATSKSGRTTTSKVETTYIPVEIDSSTIVPFTVKGVTFNMIRVKGGTFTMGFTSEQYSNNAASERPAHKVTLSDYCIGETEVTQGLWEAVMGKIPSKINDSWKGTTRPVECVSWKDCQKFIEKLNELTGKKFRLPTEAEWEYAARGGNKSRGYIYSGSNNINDVAWWKKNYSKNKNYNHLLIVKTKHPNELGIYDMSGNVREWCQDRYGAYTDFEVIDPIGPSSGSDRVLRGGGSLSDYDECRVSKRRCDKPSERFLCYGLRLALSE